MAGTVPAGDTVAGTACKAAGTGAGNGYPHGSHLCTRYYWPSAPPLPLALLLIALPQAFVWLSAAFGLTMDLKRPNLVWTNEITVIKQRLTVLLAMLGGWVYAALVGVLYYPFGIDMGAAWYLLAWTVLTVADAGAAALAPPHRQPPVRRPVIVSET